MAQNQVHDEIKSVIAKHGFTLTEVVNRINQNRGPGEQTTVQNISNKLARGTIKFSEVLEITSVMGLKINWENA